MINFVRPVISRHHYIWQTMESLIARGCCTRRDLTHDNDNKDRISFYFNHCGKLEAFNWLRELSDDFDIPDVIEVRFKNTRKDYYRNVNGLRLKRGDFVAVEASPGHDIGQITLAGEIVHKQIDKTRHTIRPEDLKKVYRKAKPADLDKWKEAIELEHNTMLKARKIADDLELNMKIGDVEYQGDKTKAIFYYIADERVDFRQLIKVLAEEFRIRIEMRQIGARQEAGRIGGIGTCGRELCCASFITNFVSVTTQSARVQEVSLNPQKLAGQCGKLKCCLNYELPGYLDARKHFPDKNIVLKTRQGNAHHQKTDVYRGVMWYSLEGENSTSLLPVTVERVIEIIRLNRNEEIPDTLSVTQVLAPEGKQNDYQNVVGQESLTRFSDKNNQGKGKKKKKKRKNSNNKQQRRKS